jgi:hypothetical protein
MQFGCFEGFFVVQRRCSTLLACIAKILCFIAGNFTSFASAVALVIAL